MGCVGDETALLLDGCSEALHQAVDGDNKGAYLRRYADHRDRRQVGVIPPVQLMGKMRDWHQGVPDDPGCQKRQRRHQQQYRDQGEKGTVPSYLIAHRRHLSRRKPHAGRKGEDEEAPGGSVVVQGLESFGQCGGKRGQLRGAGNVPQGRDNDSGVGIVVVDTSHGAHPRIRRLRVTPQQQSHLAELVILEFLGLPKRHEV